MYGKKRWWVVMTAGWLVAAGLGGCSDDTDEEPGGSVDTVNAQVRNDLAGALVSSGLADEVDAECLVDRLLARYDQAALETLAAAGRPSEAFIADVAEFTQDCLTPLAPGTTR